MGRTRDFLLTFFLLTGTLTACSRSERAISEEAQSLIDQRRYPDAIHLLEKEIPNHPETELKIQLGYAYLGNSGIELLEMASQVRSLGSFNSLELTNQPENKVCPKTPDAAGFPLVCLPIVKLNHFPEPDQPDLLKGLALFNQMNPNPAGTGKDINLLLALIQMGMAVKDYERLISPPPQYQVPEMKTDRNLQIAAASYSIRYLKQSLDSLFAGITRLLFSYDRIRESLNEYQNKPLIRIGSYNYYLTRHFSESDFLEFFLASVREAAAAEGTRLKNSEGNNVESFAGALESELNQLRFKIDGMEGGFFDQAFSEMLSPGAVFVPEKVSDLDLRKIDVDDLVKMTDLPKIIQRTIIAIRSSWTQENAQLLFNAVDDIRIQTGKMEVLIQEWLSFRDDAGEESLGIFKEDFEDFEKRTLADHFGVDSKPDFQALANWYDSVSLEMEALIEKATLDAPDGSKARTLPALYAHSEEWVHFNLY